MKTYKGMPYWIDLSNVAYPVKDEYHFALVTNSGDYVSDCLLINQYGQACPGLEYPIPVCNENLFELSYKYLVNHTHFCGVA